MKYISNTSIIYWSSLKEFIPDPLLLKRCFKPRQTLWKHAWRSYKSINCLDICKRYCKPNCTYGTTFCLSATLVTYAQNNSTPGRRFGSMFEEFIQESASPVLFVKDIKNMGRTYRNSLCEFISEQAFLLIFIKYTLNLVLLEYYLYKMIFLKALRMEVHMWRMITLNQNTARFVLISKRYTKISG